VDKKEVDRMALSTNQAIAQVKEKKHPIEL